MTDEVDDFLAHHGVPGMKWGKRKAQGSSSLADKGPSYARAALLGAVGNSKARFKDPKALKQRATAGKLFAGAIASSLAGTALSAVAASSNNPSVRSGASAAANILNLGGSAVGLASLATGITAVTTERKARQG